jgi:hypothetical protein
MLFDSLDQVMSLYAPTTAAASFQNYIDRLAKMENASGAPLYGYVNVNTTVTSGGSATVQFQVIGNATDATFASGNVVLADSGAIAKATLVAGYQIPLAISHAAMGSHENTGSFLRYVTILVTIGTADLTAGKFNGWITNAPVMNDNLSYPAGYTV